MRIIGKINNEKDALRFGQFLSFKGIQNEIDIRKNTDWGSDDYGNVDCGIWINDEDKISESMDWLARFQQNPTDPIFNQDKVETFEKEEAVEIKEELSVWEKQPMGIVTKLILFTCCFIYFITEMTNPVVVANTIPFPTPVYASPVEKALLFDYPKTYDLVDKLIKLFGYNALKNPEQLTAEGKYLVQQINQTPYWQGLYDYVLHNRLSEIKSTPMFEKIQSGEVWRLFSPCLLHGNLLHIFFNMLWLIVVGKQLEMRLLPFRYILFILIAGVFSNTAQYLMGGPNFIGFSGVIAAMLGYIWVRQKNAPWEGYQLDRMTMMFVLVFILGIAGLQAVGFILEYFFNIAVSPGVANTAHLSGALAGVVLGKLDFFKWK